MQRIVIFLRSSALLLPLVCGWPWPAALAVEEGSAPESRIIVHSAYSELDDNVYRLDANLEYLLSDAALEALDSGVPLIFELEIEVYQARKWMWDDVQARLLQRYRIEYHALTRQYLVTNLNSRVQNSFASRTAALAALGRVYDLPLLDKSLLQPGESYNGRMRAYLVINELPAPLRPWAYLASEWRLSSEWFSWSLQ